MLILANQTVWYISQENNSTKHCLYTFLRCIPHDNNSEIIIDDDFQKYMIDLNDS